MKQHQYHMSIEHIADPQGNKIENQSLHLMPPITMICLCFYKKSNKIAQR